MLRNIGNCVKQHNIVGVSVRCLYTRPKPFDKTNHRRPVVPKDNTVTWSTGEVTHPAPPDCELGSKGNYPYDLPDGGKQYFGFAYYPRPGEKDPEFEPAPLHMVTRTRCLKGKPWYDRDIMRRFGLDGKRSDVAILKNNPENNAKLWKIKHLVKITPITLPKDLPDDAHPRHCFLKENGELIYSKKVELSDDQLEEDPNMTAKKWNRKFIDEHTRKNWYYPHQLKLC